MILLIIKIVSVYHVNCIAAPKVLESIKKLLTIRKGYKLTLL